MEEDWTFVTKMGYTSSIVKQLTVNVLWLSRGLSVMNKILEYFRQHTNSMHSAHFASSV